MLLTGNTVFLVACKSKAKFTGTTVTSFTIRADLLASIVLRIQAFVYVLHIKVKESIGKYSCSVNCGTSGCIGNGTTSNQDICLGYLDVANVM